MKIKEAKVLYDASGKKAHVMLPIKVYQKLLEVIEDAQDIRAMKEATSSEPNIPWEEVKKRISTEKL